MLDLTGAFATFPVLHTERLTLRALTPDDADATFQIMADPQVMRYFGSPPMRAVSEAAERIERITAAFTQQEGVRWAITERDGGQLLGTCGFWRLLKPHHRAEIGYELVPGAWGRGIMPEALRAALEWGFTTLGLHSVEAHIDPANTSSRRVLEKLGFVQEGYFRENFYDAEENRYADTAVYSLVKPEGG